MDLLFTTAFESAFALRFPPLILRNSLLYSSAPSVSLPCIPTFTDASQFSSYLFLHCSPSLPCLSKSVRMLSGPRFLNDVGTFCHCRTLLVVFLISPLSVLSILPELDLRFSSSALPFNACKHSAAWLHQATNAFSCTSPIMDLINWNTLNISAANAAANSLLSSSRRCASAYTATYMIGIIDEAMYMCASLRVRRHVRHFSEMKSMSFIIIHGKKAKK